MCKMKKEEGALKKSIAATLLLASSLMLSACTVQSNAADLYKQEMPIRAEINLPQSISPGDEITVQTVLTQAGEKLERASFVHFEIWKQDGSVRYPMAEAEETGSGVYQMNVTFQQEGLYYIEVHAGNNGSLISPQKQFVVGELSESELDALKQGRKKEEDASGHHH